MMPMQNIFAQRMASPGPAAPAGPMAGTWGAQVPVQGTAQRPIADPRMGGGGTFGAPRQMMPMQAQPMQAQPMQAQPMAAAPAAAAAMPMQNNIRTRLGM